MDNQQLIIDFANRVAPAPNAATNTNARHTLTSLSRFLCVTPDEVKELCEAELLCAAEPWPGAPSLIFNNSHLFELRRQIALCHAEDCLEKAGEETSVREFSRIVNLSWEKRRADVIELTDPRKRTEFGNN